MTSLFLETSTSSTKENVFIILGLIHYLIGIVLLIGATIRTLGAIIYKRSLKVILIYWIRVGIFSLVLYGFIKLKYDIFVWIPFAMFITIWYWRNTVFTKQSLDFFKP